MKLLRKETTNIHKYQTLISYRCLKYEEFKRRINNDNNFGIYRKQWKKKKLVFVERKQRQMREKKKRITFATDDEVASKTHASTM